LPALWIALNFVGTFVGVTEDCIFFKIAALQYRSSPVIAKVQKAKAGFDFAGISCTP